MDQCEREYGTSGSVQTDYAALARSVKGVRGIFGGYTPESLLAALEDAYEYDGLCLLHVPVYWGKNELGGLVCLAAGTSATGV